MPQELTIAFNFFMELTLTTSLKNGRLFHKTDLDNDGKIECEELQSFIVGVNI
jgi:hypothetical protein